MAGVSVEPNDMEATYDVTASYSNRFVVSTTVAGLRIAFGEQYGEEFPPHFRTAIFLAPHDAIELLNVLEGMLSTAREKMREEEENSAQQDPASTDASHA